MEARSRANKLDKALDGLEKGIELKEQVESKVEEVTNCTCLNQYFMKKALACADACVVILRPVCGPLAKILGVSACDSRSTIGPILPHRQQQCVPSLVVHSKLSLMYRPCSHAGRPEWGRTFVFRHSRVRDEPVSQDRDELFLLHDEGGMEQ